MLFSNLLSKNVISLYDGTNEGVVIAGHFDKNLRKLTVLEIASEHDNELLDEYILSTKNIYKIGEDAVLIKNNTSLQLKDIQNENNFTLINSMAYLTNGKQLGKITDFEYDLNYKITSLLIKDIIVDISKLASFSNGTVIFYDDDFKAKVSKFKPTTKKVNLNKNENRVASILPLDEAINTTQNIEKFEDTNEKQPLKTVNLTQIDRFTANSNLLLGKKLTKNITSINGELIAKKDAIITSKIISLANSHQKLRELILYSK